MAVRQDSAATPPALFRQDEAAALPPLAYEDFGDDEFEDAKEELPKCTIELQLAFDNCENAIKKFFRNDLIGAMEVMKPWCHDSLYHSLGQSIFEFIPAILTFDRDQISRAGIALKRCINICNKHRRNVSLVESMIRKTNFASFTDLEAHAELCFAEALLLQAAMTLMEGEDLTGLIMSTIKVKNCYSCYKDCAKILERKKWETEESRIHFQSGVRLGVATFNLMISLLPPKLVSLLEFVGFSGNKALGLSELAAGSCAPGLRSVLCDLVLLAYHLVLAHFIGAVGDQPACELILKRQLEVFPNSVWFLIFKGRLQLLRGRFAPALASYQLAIHSQNTWTQFHHVCYWEMMWVNGLSMEWREAAHFAGRLLEESSWSRTIYSYARAAMLMQLGSDMKPDELITCNELLRNASYYKQRIAGKSLPMEKFIVKRCSRYHAQKFRLVLPAVELLCLWNLFAVLAHNERAASDMLKLIESTRSWLEGSRQEWMRGFEADNRAMLRYMHGCCLAAMGLPRLALDSLASVLSLKDDIKEDTYLVPYAVAEMGMCHHQLGDSERAIQMLTAARKRYSGYSLESRLHFRLHSRLQMVKAEVAAAAAKNSTTT